MMKPLTLSSSGVLGVDPVTAGVEQSAENGANPRISRFAQAGLILALCLPVLSLTLTGFDSIRRVGMGIVSILLLLAAWNGIRRCRSFLPFAVGALFAWLLASSFRAPNPQVGAEAGMVALGGLLLGWAIWSLPGMSDQAVRWTPTAIAWASIPVAMVGWLQNFGVELGPWFDAISEVPASLFGESNLGGIWCALAIPWLVAEIVRKGPARVSAVMGLTALAGYQFISKSRASFLALALGLLAALVFYLIRNRRRPDEGGLRLVVLPVLAVLVGYGAGFSLLRWRTPTQFVQEARSTYSINQRIEHWKSTTAMWKERPVLGVGLGGFQAAYHAYRSDGEVRALGVLPGRPERFKVLTGAHQTWLQLAAEAGLPAVLGFLALTGGGLFLWWRKFSGLARDSFIVGAAAAATLIAGVTAGMFNSLHVAPAHWTILAISAGLLWSICAAERAPDYSAAGWRRGLVVMCLVLAVGSTFLLVRKVQGRWELYWADRRAASAQRLDAVVSANPFAADSRLAAAKAWMKEGRPDHGRAHLEHLVGWEPENPAFRYWLGRLEVLAGRPEAASAHVQVALNRAAGWAAPHFGLGLVAVAGGDATRAAEAFGRAVELEPAWADAHRELARALSALGKADDAARHIAEADRLSSRGNSGSGPGP